MTSTNLVKHIEELKKTKYLVGKVGFNFNKPIKYLPNMAWGLILGGILSVAMQWSFTWVALLIIVGHFLTTGAYTYLSSQIMLKIVDEKDFEDIKLNNIEKNIILSAKKRHITYGKLLKELVH